MPMLGASGAQLNLLLATVKPGDYVLRNMAGIYIVLRADRVDQGKIFCGAPGSDYWTFDQRTGAEIDPDLDWGPPPLHTGSFLVHIHP